MRMSILVLIATLGLISTGWSQLSVVAGNDAEVAKTSEAEKLFEQGREALFQGRYDLAIERLKKAVKEDETKVSYRLYLARAYYYAENEKEAQKLLAGIIETTPDHVEAGQLLAEIYARQKKWQEVVGVLDPLLKYRHDYPTYHLLAEARYNLNDYKQARKNFEEAVKLNPNSGSDYYQLGNIYLAGNAFALAAEAYQSALRLGVETPILHYKLGSAYFNLRNYFGRISAVTVKGGNPGTISGDWYLVEPVPGQKDVFHAAAKELSLIHISEPTRPY